MKVIKSLLQILVFVGGIGLAFAFTGNNGEKPMEYWAIIDGNFENVTQQVLTGQYSCEDALEGHCLYDAENGNPISPSGTKYVPN